MRPEQHRLLAAIIRLTADGVSPSYAELAEEIGAASKSTIGRLLRGLRDEGLIRFQPARTRSIVVLADNPAYTQAVIHGLPTPALLRLAESAVAELEQRGVRALEQRGVRADYS